MYTQWLWGASAFYGWPNDIAKYISEYMMYYVDIYYGSIVQLFQWNYILLELIFIGPPLLTALLRQRLHSLQLKLQQLILLGQGLLLCEKSNALRGVWCNYLYLHRWRLTWNIIMEVWKIIFLSKWVICRFHVDLPGCTWLISIDPMYIDVNLPLHTISISI